MTIVELRVPGGVQRELLADVTRAQEWAGYLLCGVARLGGREVLLGREWCAVPEQDRIIGTGHGMTWHPDFDVRMLNRMQRDQLSAVVLHHHGGSDPGLSKTDRETAASLLPFLSREAPGRPHAFAVLGDRAIAGGVYQDGVHVGDLCRIRVSTSSLDDWTEDDQSGRLVAHEHRHDRLIRGFGSGGLVRLRRARIGLVGCGGGGSHVVQQLAYLGIGALVLVDGDPVEDTNLNRLIGAIPASASRSVLDRLLRRGLGDVGRPKVEVMARLARDIAPDIEVTAINDSFPSSRTIDALRGCDVIVACVDRLHVRDDLNRFAKRYLVPMLDVGIEITPDADHIGNILAITGRMTKVLVDGPCLRCQGVVTDSLLEAERGGKPPGYTGPVDIPAPAVVTLNGIIASAATTEVLQLITGFAAGAGPNCGWIYDGLAGTVERVHKVRTSCASCSAEIGLGDA